MKKDMKSEPLIITVKYKELIIDKNMDTGQKNNFWRGYFAPSLNGLRLYNDS